MFPKFFIEKAFSSPGMTLPCLEFRKFMISQIQSITGLCDRWLFVALFSFFNGGRFISRNEQRPPTAETWLAEIPLSDQSPFSFYCCAPYCHHITQLEPIFRALSGTIPFGRLSTLSQAVRISDSTLSHWKKLLKVDPSWNPSRRAYAATRRIFTGLQEKAP
jgi:hypothetical protein